MKQERRPYGGRGMIYGEKRCVTCTLSWLAHYRKILRGKGKKNRKQTESQLHYWCGRGENSKQVPALGCSEITFGGWFKSCGRMVKVFACFITALNSRMNVWEGGNAVHGLTVGGEGACSWGFNEAAHVMYELNVRLGGSVHAKRKREGPKSRKGKFQQLFIRPTGLRQCRQQWKKRPGENCGGTEA